MNVLEPYAVDLRRLRLPGAAVLGGAAILAHLPSSVGLPCPLRTATGVPCPFCGITTSLRALGGGQVTAALRVAPLGIGVALLSVLAALGVGPSKLRLPTGAWLGVLLAEWVFELYRYHLL